MRQYTIPSDLVQVKAVQPIVYKQFDNGDKLEYEFFKDGEKIVLTNEVVLAFFQLADDTVVQKTCSIEDGNAIAKLDANILSLAATVSVEFTIYHGGERTTTRTLPITVERSINKHEAIKASPQWDIVEQVLGDGPLIIGEAEAATVAANVATQNADAATARANTEAAFIEGRRALIDKSITDAATAVLKSEGAVLTADQAKAIAEIIRDQFNRIISETGDSIPEITQARWTFPNLNARLDDMLQFADETGKKYKFELAQENGRLKFLYEEVL